MGNGQRTRIGYDTTTGELYVDRTRAGRSDFSPVFPAVHRAKLARPRGKLELRIFLDSSSVEVFSADGQRQHLRPRSTPTRPAPAIESFADGGTAHLKSFTAQTLGHAIKG